MTTNKIDNIHKHYPKKSKPSPTVCQKCGRLIEPKFIGGFLDFGRWFSFNECQECSRKSKRAKAAREKRIRFVDEVSKAIGCNIPQTYRNARMGYLDNQLIQVVLSDYNIYLWGNPGVGKTYATMALLRYYAVRGKIICRYNFKSLIQILKASFTTREDLQSKIFKPIFTGDLTVLDDVAIGSVFEQETLYRIIDKRIESLKKTVIVSNLSQQQLSIDMRICSRLKLYRNMQLIGKDRRLNKLCNPQTFQRSLL